MHETTAAVAETTRKFMELLRIQEERAKKAEDSLSLLKTVREVILVIHWRERAQRAEAQSKYWEENAKIATDDGNATELLLIKEQEREAELEAQADDVNAAHVEDVELRCAETDRADTADRRVAELEGKLNKYRNGLLRRLLNNRTREFDRLMGDEVKRGRRMGLMNCRLKRQVAELEERCLEISVEDKARMVKQDESVSELKGKLAHAHEMYVRGRCGNV